MISAPNWRALIDRLKLRKRAYEQIILGPPGTASHEFLTDLSRFCRAYESTFHPDPRMHALLEGRREVWLRIVAHLHLDPEQLAQIYGATVVQKLGEAA